MEKKTIEERRQIPLTRKLMRTSRLLNRYLDQPDLRSEMNEYRGQGRVLKMLKLKPEISQRELGMLLDMRPQSLGEILTKLEKKGYIERKTNDEDKRRKLVILTEEGKNADDSIRKPLDEEKIFEGFTEEEKVQAGDFLLRIGDNLDKYTDPNMPRGPRFGHGHGPFGHGGPRGPRGFGAPREDGSEKQGE